MPCNRRVRHRVRGQVFGPWPGQGTTQGTGPRVSTQVSVVIPVVGDTEALHRLLSQLQALTPPPDELVVVDGGANEDCARLARSRGCVYVQTSAGRGRQLHAGALQARGDVLWFLHADASPPANGLLLIRDRCATGAPGGFFGFRFTGPSTWYKQALAQLINWRTRWGIPYGDQGLFVSRLAYYGAGGFADLPLFEEVPLVRALRRRGNFSRVAADLGVSPRRWEQDGWLRRTLGNRLLALGYGLGVPPARLARTYRARHINPSSR